jgi:hypothetical protein
MHVRKNLNTVLMHQQCDDPAPRLLDTVGFKPRKCAGRSQRVTKLLYAVCGTSDGWSASVYLPLKHMRGSNRLETRLVRALVEVGAPFSFLGSTDTPFSRYTTSL